MSDESNDLESSRIDTAEPVAGRAFAKRAAAWPNVALLTAAIAGLWLAHGVVMWSGELSNDDVTIWTASLTIASLGVLGIAITRLVSSAESRLRHVFCGRRVLAVGGFLLVVAAILVVSILQREPFQLMMSSGQPTERDMVDAGFVLAVIFCLTGAGVAFVSAADAFHEERHWERSMRRYDR